MYYQTTKIADLHRCIYTAVYIAHFCEVKKYELHSKESFGSEDLIATVYVRKSIKYIEENRTKKFKLTSTLDITYLIKYHQLFKPSFLMAMG